MRAHYDRCTEGGNRESKRASDRQRMAASQKEVQRAVKKTTARIEREVEKAECITDPSTFTRKTSNGKRYPLYPELAVFLSHYGSYMLHSSAFFEDLLGEQNADWYMEKSIGLIDWLTDEKINELESYCHTSYLSTKMSVGTAGIIVYFMENGDDEIRLHILEQMRFSAFFLILSDSVEEFLHAYSSTGCCDALASSLLTLCQWMQENGYMSDEMFLKLNIIKHCNGCRKFNEWHEQAADDMAYAKFVPNVEVTHIGIGNEALSRLNVRASAVGSFQNYALCIVDDERLEKDKTIEELQRSIKDREQKIERLEERLRKPPEVKITKEIVENPDIIRKLDQCRARSEKLEEECATAKEAITKVEGLAAGLRKERDELLEKNKKSQTVYTQAVPDDELTDSMLSLVKNKKLVIVADKMTKSKFDDAGFTSCQYVVVENQPVHNIQFDKMDMVLVFTTRIRHIHLDSVVDDAKVAGLPIRYVQATNMSLLIKEIFITLFN